MHEISVLFHVLLNNKYKKRSKFWKRAKTRTHLNVGIESHLFMNAIIMCWIRRMSKSSNAIAFSSLDWRVSLRVTPSLALNYAKSGNRFLPNLIFNDSTFGLCIHFAIQFTIQFAIQFSRYAGLQTSHNKPYQRTLYLFNHIHLTCTHSHPVVRWQVAHLWPEQCNH